MFDRIHHLGYAVEDLKAAARFYEESFGARFLYTEPVEGQGVIAAMLRMGESEIELVQPTRTDSPVGKFLEKRGEGFHHVAYQVEDLEAALRGLRERGVELIDDEPRTGAGGTRVAFVHPKSVFGVLTELVELPEKGE